MLTNIPESLSRAAAIDALIAIAATFVFALAIAWVYKRTHQGLSYSQSFVFTLILLAILSALTMLIIQNSLARAFALLGAFTIIRFRTAIKDTKDVSFIFWSLITGMAVGTGNYGLAAVGTAAISLVIFGLSRFRFGSLRNYDHILSFTVATDTPDQEAYKEVFRKYLKSSVLLNVNARQEGKKLEFTYNIKLDDDSQADAFIKELEILPGVNNSNLFIAKDDIEY